MLIDRLGGRSKHSKIETLKSQGEKVMTRLKQLRGAQDRKKTTETMMSMVLVLRLRRSCRSFVWLDSAISTRFEVPLKERQTLRKN
jgi:hypothetical protein